MAHGDRELGEMQRAHACGPHAQALHGVDPRPTHPVEPRDPEPRRGEETEDGDPRVPVAHLIVALIEAGAEGGEFGARSDLRSKI